MGESYSYADILFGLYKEYVLLQEQLSSLNKYVLLEENNLSGVKFSVTEQITDDNVRMLCYLYNRKTNLEKILEKLNFGVDANYNVSYVNEINGKYAVLQYPELLDKTKQQEFSQSVWYILNTDFAKNIKLIHYGIGYDNNPFLSVGSDGIHGYLNGDFKLCFDSSRDEFLHVNSYNKKLTKEKMEYLLNLRFPDTRFSEYYRNLIEGCDTFGMDVSVCGDFGCSKTGKFEIVPESKKLIRVKK